MKKLDGKVIVMYADCKITRGVVKCTIVDITRKRLFELPIEVADVIESIINTKGGSRIYEPAITNDVINFLIYEELAFWTDTPNAFPAISEDVAVRSRLTNALIDIKDTIHDLHYILPQLDALGCEMLQIRFFRSYPIGVIQGIVDKVTESNIRSLDLYLQSDGLNHEDIVSLLSKYGVISNFVLFNARDNNVLKLESGTILNADQYINVRQEMNSCEDCGYISKRSFHIGDVRTFNEYKLMNSCLSRKVSIDEMGQVCNCPAIRSKFGYYSEVNIKDIVTEPAFMKYEKLNKDSILVCKDCEYRYVCTDCRAITQGDGNYGKPTNCSYDPYTGEWT